MCATLRQYKKAVADPTFGPVIETLTRAIATLGSEIEHLWKASGDTVTLMEKITDELKGTNLADGRTIDIDVVDSTPPGGWWSDGPSRNG